MTSTINDNNSYMLLVRSTSIFPTVGGCRAVYPLLKIQGELAELSRARTASEVLLELGDVVWYFAVLCDIFGVDYAKASSQAPTKLDDCAELHVALGDISERVGKWLRDGTDEASPFAPTHRQMIELKLYTAGRCINHMIGAAGLTISRVEHANTTKLKSRAARSVLHGDGDNR